VAIGDRLHAVDGCHIALRVHPAAVEPGGYRGRKLPRFMTVAEVVWWLSSGPRRKRCRRCWR
jgi:hypothetical protein